MSYVFDPQGDHSQPSGFLVDEGPHIFAVADVEPGQGAKGPYLTFTFMVIGGTADTDDGKEMRYQIYSFSEKARWRAAGLFKAIDGKMTPFDITNQTLLDERLLGRVFAGVVVHKDDTYQGKTKKKQSVEDARSLTDAERRGLIDLYGEPMIPRSLVDKFNGVLDTAADGTPITEDDVPF